ncbi:hypothetical protein C1H46_033576 [Malus baccata]|uniref:Uncharacterized protein n=1 Tax=Malus baccata TaxID=106549 RepID=A0A540L340_MALBA|nr:hypothetical protein C1H46_033576 [Malus baccata]
MELAQIYNTKSLSLQNQNQPFRPLPSNTSNPQVQNTNISIRGHNNPSPSFSKPYTPSTSFVPTPRRLTPT